GRYKLLNQIGRGGFSIVWRALDESSGQPVAVKVLQGKYRNDASRRGRFFRGARVMAQLRHPNIPRIVQANGEDAGCYFFVMEYLGNGDFRQAIVKKRLSRDKAGEILFQVATALHYAHTQGAVHRDVKPSNILLAADDSARLTDFDLVRVTDST